MDRYKRSILKKNKIYRPYTLDGIGNFIFFSPCTDYFNGNAWNVRSSGVLDDGLNVDGSYGHIYLDGLFQNSIKLLVVKIAGPNYQCYESARILRNTIWNYKFWRNVWHKYYRFLRAHLSRRTHSCITTIRLSM